MTIMLFPFTLFQELCGKDLRNNRKKKRTWLLKVKILSSLPPSSNFWEKGLARNSFQDKESSRVVG